MWPTSLPHPWQLNAPEGSVGEMCFVLRYIGPATNPSTCYKALEKSLFKLHLSIRECGRKCEKCVGVICGWGRL